MESLFKTGLYVALGVLQLLIFAMLYCKYMEAKKIREVAEDLERELDENILSFKEQKEYLLKKVENWKLKATAPMMPDPNPPIVIHKYDLQKVKIRTEIDMFKTKEQAIRDGVDKLRDFIAPMVYSEFIEDYGKTVLYQEIWVGLSENFKK